MSCDDDKLKKFEEIFKALDKNNDGSIDKCELKSFLSEHADVNLDEEQLKALFAFLDKDGDGKICAREVLDFLAAHSD
jgi:Ca2+-binding EF-hand superfamily protein